MRKKVGRPDLETIPGLPLPIHVRSAGYNEAAPGWEEIETDKNFVQIFWCVQGCGEFIYPDHTLHLHPGEVYYRLPGEIHHHRNADEVIPWHYYWFTFDGENAAQFINSYGFEQKPLHGGICPVELFAELEIIVRKQTPFNQRFAISKATEIIARMGGNSEETITDPVCAFLAAVKKYMHDPELTVSSAAAEIGIHRTTLNKLFRQKMGITPAKHLNMVRIQYALQMLKDTSKSVKEISEITGFATPGYFCRVIREATSCTPAEYRNKVRQDPDTVR